MNTKSKNIPLNFERVDEWAATSRSAHRLEKWLFTRLLRAMDDPPIAVRLWDDEEIQNCPGPPEVTLHIREPRALWGTLIDPELYFGDAYSDGTITVEGDLSRLIELVSVHRPPIFAEQGLLGRLTRLFAPAPQTNTLSGSRQNIHHHYDLSNDFYRLWLDREYMQYTCAYFPDPAISLEAAQIAKMEHVCRKLRLKPGDKVVEAGCGWGGLARYMAQRHGVNVRAYNISHEQVSYATERAAELGLTGRVEYIEDDYRNIEGEYDAFVSVGMLEHVGTENYPSLGAVIDRCLKPDGRALIHSIGRNQPKLMNRWIEKRIFPGAYPPTLGEMTAIFQPYNFSIVDVENLRLHYALTLQHWLKRFESNRGRVLEAFDEQFFRAWRLYLTGSIVAFRLGDLQLFQVSFNRCELHDLPWSRGHLYAEPQPPAAAVPTSPRAPATVRPAANDPRPRTLPHRPQ